jgi:hypothetical protein
MMATMAITIATILSTATAMTISIANTTSSLV